jgi:hypothetical protein
MTIFFSFKTVNFGVSKCNMEFKIIPCCSLPHQIDTFLVREGTLMIRVPIQKQNYLLSLHNAF